MTSIKLFLVLCLALFSFSAVCWAQDDFDFDDEPIAAVDNFDEFHTEDAYLDDEEDGLVTDEEDDEPVEKDDFADFGDDQVIDTGDDQPKEKREFTERKSSKLRQTHVPSHLRENWQQYWIEGIFLAVIFYYIINYFQGQKINNDIANTWMRENLEFLRSQFYEVGGAIMDTDATPTLGANSSNCFNIWCTGRKGCEGMLVEIKLVARQDLLTVWRNKFNKKRIEGIDFITISYFFDDTGFGDPIVMCLGEPRLTSELWRTFTDLRTYCPKGTKERANISKNFVGCAENSEMMSHLFDAKSIATFATNDSHPPMRLGYLHISDKYEAGNNDPDDENTKSANLELRSKVLCCSLIVNPDCSSFESDNYTKGVIYLADKCKRFKLSKEAKAACEKRRAKAVEEDQKRQHIIRTEKAAERSELKRREMNRRIMEEEDPDKQRKLYQAQQDRDARKQQKKYKMKMK